VGVGPGIDLSRQDGHSVYSNLRKSKLATRACDGGPVSAAADR
jgi:hypothetical protein